MCNIYRVKVSLAEEGEVEILVEADIKLGTFGPYLMFYYVGDRAISARSIPTLLSKIFTETGWHYYKISELPEEVE